MRISEIMQTVADAIENPLGRDEYIDGKFQIFANTPTVYKIHELELHKCLDVDELSYGLVDPVKNILAAILMLIKVDNSWQVLLTQVQEPYKAQGYGSFMYDYAVMNDGLTLLSDVTQTSDKNGNNGSNGLWEKLYRQGRFTVCGYNLETNEVISLKDSSEIASKIYTQKSDVVWMATPKPLKESINEMLDRFNTRNKHRTIEWYGPNITGG